jgi:hypothetical protein
VRFSIMPILARSSCSSSNPDLSAQIIHCCTDWRNRLGPAFFRQKERRP